TPDFRRIRESSFGKLFDLQTRQCSYYLANTMSFDPAVSL
ncbi:unnamed protein product, partial [Brassica oleracea var. botrytis]